MFEWIAGRWHVGGIELERFGARDERVAARGRRGRRRRGDRLPCRSLRLVEECPSGSSKRDENQQAGDEESLHGVFFRWTSRSGAFAAGLRLLATAGCEIRALQAPFRCCLRKATVRCQASSAAAGR